jgi:hypothetical protein
MRFHVPHKVKKKDDKTGEVEISWVQKFDFNSGEVKMLSVFVHIVLAAGLMAIFLGTH